MWTVLEDDEAVGVMLVLVVAWVELENAELVIELVVNMKIDGVVELVLIVKWVTHSTHGFVSLGYVTSNAQYWVECDSLQAITRI